MHSAVIKSIAVVRRGDVRRAKLYYLRNLSGKAARIKEKISSKLKTNVVAKKTAAPASESEE